jgi:hypothetical protein
VLQLFYFGKHVIVPQKLFMPSGLGALCRSNELAYSPATLFPFAQMRE